jgi:hypothetical protein
VTIGEDRVRIKFNPSGYHDRVDEIKQRTADLIDLCEAYKVSLVKPADPEIVRLWSLAQTYYENAAMWGVKAATAEWGDKE